MITQIKGFLMTIEIFGLNEKIYITEFTGTFAREP
jgi:hypothetical protein